MVKHSWLKALVAFKNKINLSLNPCSLSPFFPFPTKASLPFEFTRENFFSPRWIFSSFPNFSFSVPFHFLWILIIDFFIRPNIWWLFPLHIYVFIGGFSSKLFRCYILIISVFLKDQMCKVIGFRFRLALAESCQLRKLNHVMENLMKDPRHTPYWGSNLMGALAEDGWYLHDGLECTDLSPYVLVCVNGLANGRYNKFSLAAIWW